MKKILFIQHKAPYGSESPAETLDAALVCAAFGQPVSVLGVNFDGLQGAELSKASAELGINYRVLAQDPAERWQLPRAEVLPVTYIVGPDGVLRERLLGEQTAAGLQARLAQLQEGEH